MSRSFVVEPADAVAHGFPPLRIEVDLDGTPFMARTFINDRIYAAMIGPPGGPLFFRFMKVPRVIEHGDSLEALVRDIYGNENLILGERGEMDIQGQRCITQLFFTGMGPIAAANCALIVPPPSEGASAPGLLLVFGHGGTPARVKDCLEIASFEPLAQILESMQLDLAVVVPSAKKAEPAAVAKAVSADDDDNEDDEEEEVEAPKMKARPQVSEGIAAGALVNYVGEIRESIKRMGCWIEGMPTPQMYTTWTPLQQRMYSMQASVQAIESTIQGVASRDPNQPIMGIVQSLQSMKQLVAGAPEAAELVALLDRGPIK